MSVTCGRSVVFSGYSGFLHQQHWPPRYNWNIVESGVKHHKTKQNQLLLPCKYSDYILYNFVFSKLPILIYKLPNSIKVSLQLFLPHTPQGWSFLQQALYSFETWYKFVIYFISEMFNFLTQMNKGPYFFYYKNDIYHLIFQSFVALYYT